MPTCRPTVGWTATWLAGAFPVREGDPATGQAILGTWQRNPGFGMKLQQPLRGGQNPRGGGTEALREVAAPVEGVPPWPVGDPSPDVVSGSPRRGYSTPGVHRSTRRCPILRVLSATQRLAMVQDLLDRRLVQVGPPGLP